MTFNSHGEVPRYRQRALINAVAGQSADAEMALELGYAALVQLGRCVLAKGGKNSWPPPSRGARTAHALVLDDHTRVMRDRAKAASCRSLPSWA